MFRYFPVFLLLGALGGCVSQPVHSTRQPVPQNAHQFQYAFMQAVRDSVESAAEDELVGAIRLRTTIDRQGKPLACKTEAADARTLGKQPVHPPSTDPATLANVVEQACWNTVYPIAPRTLYNDSGQLEVVMPLMVHLVLESSSDWPLRNAQQRYFHQRLLRDEPVDSIGSLLLRYQADEHGAITGCLANLRPLHARPDAFKLDTALQNRLSAACLTLNLSDMPGFTLNKEKQAVGTVALTYAPWTVGRK